MKRKFTAPPTDERCQHTVTLGDGSTAQCMRREAWDGLGLCWQHQRKANEGECDCQAPDAVGVKQISMGCPIHNEVPA
jgi:hypothetical protein